MAAKDFIISLGLDTKQAKKALDALEKRIGKVGKGMLNDQAALNRLKSTENQLATTTLKLKNLQQQLDNKRLNTQKKINNEVMDGHVRALRAKEKADKSQYDQNMSWKNRMLTQRGVVKNQVFRSDRLIDKGGLSQDTVIGLQQGARKLEQLQSQASKGGKGKEQALYDLRVALQDYGMKLKYAQLEQSKFNKKLNLTKFATKSARRSIRNLAQSYISLFAVIAAGRSSMQIAGDLEGIQAVLLASSKTSEEADKKFSWVKNMSMTMGTPIRETARGFAKISAAANEAGISQDAAKEVFLSAAEASVAFGLSSDDTAGVMRAFTQILGKQQVMMEELKLQLGDRLPTVMGIFAQSANVSTKELYKMIESGQVGTEEFMTFAKEMRRNVKDSGALAAGLNTLTRSTQRAANAWDLFSQSFWSGATRQLAIEVLDTIGNTLKKLATTLKLVLYPVLAYGVYLVGSLLAPFWPVIAAVTAIIQLTGRWDEANERLGHTSERSANTITRAFNTVRLTILYAERAVWSLGEALFALADLSFFKGFGDLAVAMAEKESFDRAIKSGVPSQISIDANNKRQMNQSTVVNITNQLDSDPFQKMTAKIINGELVSAVAEDVK